ncbi:MAG: acetate--CoA ligase family protein [Alphaproteobacteria bacterium]
MNDPALDALLRPRSVAVIGASTDPDRIGGRPIQFLRRAGFAGPIYPVNPRAAEVQGIRAWPSVADLPEAPDVAIVALPAGVVAATVEAGLARGTRAFIVFSAGFGEAGEEGRRAQADIAARVRAAGGRMIGPNSLGLLATGSGFFGTFATALDGAWPRPGRVAIATQSGACGSYLLAMGTTRGLGVSRFVATGNEADVDVADVVAWLAGDPDSDVIVCAVEGARDGMRLRRALDAARAAGKPVIAMKVGATEAGRAAAASHTGALAGAAEVWDGVFRQHGAWPVHSLEEAVDVAIAASQPARPASARVGLITTSGGVGVLLADAAVAAGLDPAPMPEAARARIEALLPLASGRNPVDTTAQILADMSLFGRILAIMTGDGGFDSIVAFLAHIGRNPAHFAAIEPALMQARRARPDVPFALCMLCDEELRDRLVRDGFLVFEDPTRAVRAVAALYGIAHAGPVPAADESDDGATMVAGETLDEAEAATLLAAAGVPMATARIATTARAAAAAADALGYPVALKILSPDIAHKTEVGGVRLGLADAGAVRRAFAEVMAGARAKAPSARLRGVLVAPMLSGGVEAIAGVEHDPAFGPVVMVGLGGTMVEVFRDVAFRAAPFDTATARDMIGELRGAALLGDFRGRGPADTEALAQALAALSRFAWVNRDRLASVDINPLLVRPAGTGVIGLDALIVPKTSGG